MNDEQPAPGPDGGERSDSEAAELERLRAERDELRHELEAATRPRRRRFRRTVVAILVGLTSILVILSTTVVWAHRTLLNTDVFVATVGPALQEPGVDTAVANRSTDQLFAALDVQRRLQQALPPKVAFVAGPITSATEGAVKGEVAKVYGSPKFQKLWTQVLTNTHREVVAVLRGQKSELLTVAKGYIVLNTVPLINQALGQISGLASNLTGHHVTLPTITSAELPQQAIDKLSKALGVHLPSNFGQITLVKADHLSQLQRAVKAFDRIAILLPFLTFVFIVVTLWLSVARRRTLIQLVAVVSLLTVLLRRVFIHEQDALSRTAQSPQVAHKVLGDLLSGFYDGSEWILWAAFVVLVLALVTGPYRWAVALRVWLRRGWDWLLELGNAERRAETRRWIARNATALQLGAAVVAFVLLLVVSISWVSVLVIGGLLALAELYLNAAKDDSSEGGSTGPASGATEGTEGPSADRAPAPT